jgi:hypothetical protein
MRKGGPERPVEVVEPRKINYSWTGEKNENMGLFCAPWAAESQLKTIRRKSLSVYEWAYNDLFMRKSSSLFLLLEWDLASVVSLTNRSDLRHFRARIHASVVGNISITLYGVISLKTVVLSSVFPNYGEPLLAAATVQTPWRRPVWVETYLSNHIFVNKVAFSCITVDLYSLYEYIIGYGCNY